MCALFRKARCTCTCWLALGDIFRLEDVIALEFVNTCKCGTGLASMCLTCTCATLRAMKDVTYSLMLKHMVAVGSMLSCTTWLLNDACVNVLNTST